MKRKRSGSSSLSLSSLAPLSMTLMVPKTIAEPIDLISNLSNVVIHRIMSFLPTKDVVRMSILSKRFNSLWNSFPVLDFDYTYNKQWNSRLGKNQFLDFVLDSLGKNRALNVGLRKFRLHFKSYGAVEADSRIIAAIHFAMIKKVQELDLAINPRKLLSAPLYEVPSNIFLAENSIRVLNLKGIQFEHLDMTKFPLIEELSLSYCGVLQSIRISSESIKFVKIKKCSGLPSVDILNSSNLRSIFYYGFQVSDNKEPQRGQINIMSCKSIETLHVQCTAYVTNNWIDQIVSKLKLLKKLVLNRCHMLTSIKISLEQLEFFKLVECGNLEEIELQAPELTSFDYIGGVARPCIINIGSPRLNAQLTLRKDVIYAQGWFEKFREFLGNFNHCRSLVLALKRNKSLIFSENQREGLISPLSDIKNLKVKVGEPVKNIVSLVDSLLWLAPLVETISIVSQTSEKSLKFKYDKTVAMEEKDAVCCYSSLKKCWRHYAKNIFIKNFNFVEKKSLIHEYFIRKAMRLDCVIDVTDY